MSRYLCGKNKRYIANGFVWTPQMGGIPSLSLCNPQLGRTSFPFPILPAAMREKTAQHLQGSKCQAVRWDHSTRFWVCGSAIKCPPWVTLDHMLQPKRMSWVVVGLSCIRGGQAPMAHPAMGHEIGKQHVSLNYVQAKPGCVTFCSGNPPTLPKPLSHIGGRSHRLADSVGLKLPPLPNFCSR